MSPRPRFLDQPNVWTQRTGQSRIDYASPLSHQPTPSSWMLNDLIVALTLVAVIVLMFLGVFK